MINFSTICRGYERNERTYADEKFPFTLLHSVAKKRLKAVVMNLRSSFLVTIDGLTCVVAVLSMTFCLIKDHYDVSLVQTIIMKYMFIMII